VGPVITMEAATGSCHDILQSPQTHCFAGARLPNSHTFGIFLGLSKHTVRYERNVQTGEFRVVAYTAVGPWMQQGCSKVKVGTFEAMVCSDCTPLSR
jgi:hypothetical protein